MRTKEIERLVTHIQRHETVRIVADREFGRTTLLQGLRETLTAQGFTVHNIEGDATLSSFKYGALRDQIIAPERLAQCSTPHEVRSVLEATLSRSPNSALLIDDAEDLDVATAEALAPLFASKRIVGVVVTAPFVCLSLPQRRIAQLLRADIRLELGSLTFEETGVLAQQILLGPVSSALGSEVFSLSSGIPGIAVDILRAARTGSAVRLAQGGWVLNAEDLWNQHLEETVERLLAPLETDPLLLIHSLALAGSLPVSQLHSLNAAAATRLTEFGLLTTFVDPYGIPQAAPRPALITEYFRSRSVDMIRAEALNLLDQAAKSGVISAGRKHYELERHLTRTDGYLTQNAGLARYLRERNEHTLSVSAHKWRERSSASNALRYLEALLNSSSYSIAAPEILSRTQVGDPSHKVLLQLAIHEMTLSRIIHTPSSSFTERLRKRSPEHAQALDAYGFYWLFCDAGVTPDIQEWLASEPKDPLGFSETIAAHIRVCSGTATEHTATGSAEATLPLQGVIAEQTMLVSKLWRKGYTDATETGLRASAGSIELHNLTPSLAEHFVRAQNFAAHGKPSEARKALSQALAIGGLDLRYAQVYAASLRWSAYLHFQEGHLDVADALLSESNNYDMVTGPLPGMRPAFSLCLKALFAHDRETSSRLLLAEAAACAQLSFVDTSWAMAKLAFEVSPSEAALSALDALAGHLPYANAPQITGVARAALAMCPSIASLIDEIADRADLAATADLLDAVERQRQALEVSPSTEYSLAVAAAHQKLDLVREPLTRRFGRAPDSDFDTLTPREREIAPLTATLTNREIAERLTLSIRTVENHVARAMKKLGISSRTELSATSNSSSPFASPFYPASES